MLFEGRGGGEDGEQYLEGWQTRSVPACDPLLIVIPGVLGPLTSVIDDGTGALALIEINVMSDRGREVKGERSRRWLDGVCGL
jgi:hypothetical protein